MVGTVVPYPPKVISNYLVCSRRSLHTVPSTQPTDPVHLFLVLIRKKTMHSLYYRIAQVLTLALWLLTKDYGYPAPKIRAKPPSLLTESRNRQCADRSYSWIPAELMGLPRRATWVVLFVSALAASCASSNSLIARHSPCCVEIRSSQPRYEADTINRVNNLACGEFCRRR
ncbi:hypothetical protein JB92DRAFT_1181135 [Gautieria morchelliformis]|nr:hypothetical protein JB92DRAFT_1181135 [Gautieria morchelliformis]